MEKFGYSKTLCQQSGFVGQSGERGITLLALVLTIVLLIILASVTVSMTLSSGLAEQAKHSATTMQNAEQEEQKQIENATVQINEIVESIKGKPLPDDSIIIGEPQWQPDGTANVEVSTTEEGVTIEYQIGGTDEENWQPVEDGTITGVENGETIYVRITDGEKSSKPQEKKIEDIGNPVVTVSPDGTTTNSISVSVNASDNESGMADNVIYTYYIKESTEPDSNYKSPEGATGITNNTYTFTGLTAGTSYDIKVEVNGDRVGNVGTGTLPGQSTGTIPGGDESIEQGKITFGQANWQDGKASVTISTNTGLHLQYQKNSTDKDGWKEINNNGTISDLEHGDTVYARLTDGNNYGEHTSTNILDNEAPADAAIQPNITNLLIGETLTATVTHSDAKSGVDMEKSGWVMNTNASAMGTDDTSAYTGKFTTNGETITLDSSNAGTYYLHVLTTDVAGNKTETVSSAITISAITGTVSQNGDVSWSGGQASLVLQKTEEQYKIVYKINGEGEWQEYNGTSITGLSHGDIVTACLTNTSQTTYGPETEFEIKDETAPTVTVTAQGSPSTNSVTITVQASDEQSGMKDNVTYTYYIKQSTEPESSYTTPSGASNISNAQYTFTGLTQGTNYDIKVEVNGDKAGNSGTDTTQAATDTVPGADTGLETGAITASPVTWSGGKASTTLTTNETSFKIQYQVNSTSGSWSEAADSPVTVGNLDHGNTVYARLTDGINAGDYAAINILDGTAPTVGITINEVTDNKITITVSAEDKETGLVDTGTYKYYINNELKETSEKNTYTFTGLTGSTQYTIRVEVVDKAGNSGDKSVTQQTLSSNVAPNKPIATFSSKTTSSITVSARATDNNGDNLTYTLYTSTSSTGNFTKKATSSSTASGNSVSMRASGLRQYTNYYYYVEVTDGKLTTKGDVSSAVRTYCPGTGLTCTGPFTTEKECSTCGGSGSIRTTCTGGRVSRTTGTFNNQCSSPGCTGRQQWARGKCSKCSTQLYYHVWCSSCGWDSGDETPPSSHSRTTTCSACSGTGSSGTVSSPCKHGKYATHSYCSHGYTSQHD